MENTENIYKETNTKLLTRSEERERTTHIKETTFLKDKRGQLEEELRKDCGDGWTILRKYLKVKITKRKRRARR